MKPHIEEAWRALRYIWRRQLFERSLRLDEDFHRLS